MAVVFRHKQRPISVVPVSRQLADRREDGQQTEAVADRDRQGPRRVGTVTAQPRQSRGPAVRSRTEPNPGQRVVRIVQTGQEVTDAVVESRHMLVVEVNNGRHGWCRLVVDDTDVRG